MLQLHPSDQQFYCLLTQIARFMGPTLGPSGANRTHVGPLNFIIWEGASFIRGERVMILSKYNKLSCHNADYFHRNMYNRHHMTLKPCCFLHDTLSYSLASQSRLWFMAMWVGWLLYQQVIWQPPLICISPGNITASKQARQLAEDNVYLRCS